MSQIEKTCAICLLRSDVLFSEKNKKQRENFFDAYFTLFSSYRHLALVCCSKIDVEKKISEGNATSRLNRNRRFF